MITVKTTPKTTVDCSDSNGFFINGLPPFRKPNHSIAKMFRRTYASVFRRLAVYAAPMEIHADRADEQG